MIGSTIREWLGAYRAGATPERLVGELLDRLPPGDVAFIAVVSGEDLARQLAALTARRTAVGGEPGALPLYGVPFAVKDNIDAEGLPTTAACPAFAYVPRRSAAVVDRLVGAGAIVIGKTNLDQFATGLVGTRSPYGAVPNTFDRRTSPGARARRPPSRAAWCPLRSAPTPRARGACPRH